MRFRRETIGNATLYLGDALEILTILNKQQFAGAFCDPPYSSGGTTASDRARLTSAKYLGSDYRHLYPEFAGDMRDQRAFLAWSTLWMSRVRELTIPGGIFAAFSD